MGTPLGTHPGTDAAPEAGGGMEHPLVPPLKAPGDPLSLFRAPPI